MESGNIDDIREVLQNKEDPWSKSELAWLNLTYMLDCGEEKLSQEDRDLIVNSSIAELRKQFEADNSLLKSKIRIGSLFLTEKDYETHKKSALKEWLECLKADKDNVTVLYCIGLYYYAAKDLGRANKLLEKAFTLIDAKCNCFDDAFYLFYRVLVESNQPEKAQILLNSV
jgi:hypothetical protein